MGSSNCFNVKNHATKQYIDKFKSLCGSRSNWQVWSDVITVMACAIANSTDFNETRKAKREAEYKQCIERLGGIEVPAEMLGIMTMALEENPEQDFLGDLFMRLELGNHWKGQFFTPYSVCSLMAEMNVNELNDKIQEKGYVSVNDCACGAGATLIAMANTLKRHGINYQHHALFVAQDIDRIAGMMCYIQLSLLGCPGYVVIANSLTNPIVGNALNPVEKEDQEFWYTPMFASDIWRFRTMFIAMDALLRS